MADGRARPVDVVGMVGGEVFGPSAARSIAGSDVLVASVRHLGHCPVTGEVERIELSGALPAVLDLIDERRRSGRQVCVVASGDPGFFGIARSLSARLGPGAVRVHPAPSSVALAFAGQGWSWDDAVIASAHGRPLAPAIRAVAGAATAAVLTDPSHPPQAVGAELLKRHQKREVVVVSRIGEPDESVAHTDVDGLAAGVFDPMSVVLLRDPVDRSDDWLNARWGRDDDAFAHRGGMITKSEVRAVALGKLSLPSAGVVWDVGAGSGAVGIEVAALAPQLAVYAVERNTEDAERIAANALTFGVDLELVLGEAPAALVGLPEPDRVFIGGGGIDVLDQCLARLVEGGTVVATYVLLDRALAAYERLGNMIQVRVDRCVPLGGAGIRMEPINPVFICWGPR